MRKRINNDLKISWEILRNGQAEDFTTATNIEMRAVIPNAYSIEVPYERIDNLFHIAVPANTLKLGTYHLILSYNKPDATIEGGLGTISIDQKNAFQIVRHTEDESDDGRDITGNIVVPGIPSGGTEGQYLAKINGTSYNTEWKSPEQSTGVSTINIMSQKAITDALALKVDKAEGKGLSTNDYDDEAVEEVAKIAGKQDALGFTPENVANKKTSIADNDTDYPSSKAVKTFVEAAVAQKSFYANTMTVNFGTLNQGVVADLGALGGTDVIIQEVTGANPLQVTFDFANVTEVTGFVFYGEYLGGSMHQVYIEVYNYTSLAWDLKLIIGTEGSKKWYTAPIYNANAYLSSGNMQVRFRHIGNGISSHQLVLDYIEINSGGSGGQTNISASSVNFVPSGNLSATDVASALVELDTEKVATSLVGAVSGLAQLDSTGKHKIEQYQDVILGQLKYGGTFDNNGLITSDYTTLNGQDIDLLAATDWKGFFFIHSGTTSTHHSIELEPGDWLISNGSAGWAKIDNTDAVTLVNGKKGNVTLVTDDIAEGATPTNLWFTAARVRAVALTGFEASNSAITATDTVLQLANKAQGQISDIIAKINASGLTTGYLARWDGSKLVNSNIYHSGNDVVFDVRSGGGKLVVIGQDDGTGQLILRGNEDNNNYWELGRESASRGEFHIRELLDSTYYTRFIIQRTTGNVGFGYLATASEVTNNKLAVNGSGYFNGALTVNGDTEIRSGKCIKLRPTDNNYDYQIKVVDHNLNIYAGGDLEVPSMSFINNGKVGVRTATPLTDFHVAGGDIGIDINKKIILRASDPAASYLTYTADFTERTRLISGFGIYLGSSIGDGLYLSSDGAVMLGYPTNPSNYKFAVNGSGFFNGALTINGGLLTFGANDSAGTGYRTVRVPNI